MLSVSDVILLCRYKGDKAYPWSADVSSFILYPESANQTIYSQAVTSIDAGNYSCRVVNDSQAVSHTTSLTVFGKFVYDVFICF